MTTFTEAVAAAIKAEEVTDAFGLMGAGTIRLTHHMTEDHGVRYHAARHEAGAVGAADGYARVTRKPGVAMTTWGPGLTNTVTALVTATRARSPVVLVTGDSSDVSPERSLFAAGTQGLDQRALLDVLGVRVARPHPRSVRRDVADAFRYARESQRPVALCLPMQHETTLAWNEFPEDSGRMSATPPPINERAIEAAVDALATSERPIVLAGHGAVRARAKDTLIELADKTGALLATTLRAKDYFLGHPYNLGVAGGYSVPIAAELFGRSDCIVAFGASLNLFTTKRRQLFPNAVLVQCDLDPEAMIRPGIPSVAIHGDAHKIAIHLAALVRDSSRSFRQEAASAGLGPDSWRGEFDDCSSSGALDPRAVCSRLDELLPRERTVVADAGSVGEFPPALMSVPEPDASLWLAGDFGAVGTGLAPAVGAAIGRPDRTTIAILGDGGFFMAMQELDTAVRERIPLLVVCLNDRGFGSEYHHMRDDDIPHTEGARFETPDLAEVARAMGCEGAQISSLDQLNSVPEQLEALDRPLFLDCLITQELVPSQLRQHLTA